MKYFARKRCTRPSKIAIVEKSHSCLSGAPRPALTAATPACRPTPVKDTGRTSAPARPPSRRPLPAADQAPPGPGRPHQRVRAGRVEAQVKTYGRVLEPHRLNHLEAFPQPSDESSE